MTCMVNGRGTEEENRVTTGVGSPSSSSLRMIACPSCGHSFSCQEKASSVHDLPGLPAGMKFDPSDTELLQHLEGKVRLGAHKLHPLIDEFIVTIEGDEGICYTHPQKLPGLSKDGQVRHFFHRPSKAYTTGTRKRRKVHTAEADGTETRWHKTGKTRSVLVDGQVKGHKKILVLYTNYGKQKKPEKTNWVMHQYHLGNNEDEKEGELVVSKVFYQTQPRQCGATTTDASPIAKVDSQAARKEAASLLTLGGSNFVDLYDSSVISFEHHDRPMPRVHPNYTCP